MAVRWPLLLVILAISGCGAPLPVANEILVDRDGPAPSATPAATAEAIEIPVAFRGIYDRNQASCAAPSDLRLTVSATELHFHESLGRVGRIRTEGPDRIAIEADYQGEGERWSARQHLRLSDEGTKLTIVGDGAETTRVRCTEVSAQPPARWRAAASGEGDGLSFEAEGRRIVTLFCPAGSSELIVNVPTFRPVGSEERMSFGSGGLVVALVADVRGDRERGGVTGRGPIPGELDRILSGGSGVAVNYGAQNSGPHPSPPVAMAAAFAIGCRD